MDKYRPLISEQELISINNKKINTINDDVINSELDKKQFLLHQCAQVKSIIKENALRLWNVINLNTLPLKLLDYTIR